MSVGSSQRMVPKSVLSKVEMAGGVTMREFYCCHHKMKNKNIHIKCQPCPSFPCFFGIPCFSVWRGFPCFLSVFPFFSRDFRGSAGIKNPCFFGGSPCRFPKKQKTRRTENEIF